jgi:hypothetical protein
MAAVTAVIVGVAVPGSRHENPADLGWCALDPQGDHAGWDDRRQAFRNRGHAKTTGDQVQFRQPVACAVDDARPARQARPGTEQWLHVR